MHDHNTFSRRTLLRGAALGGLALGLPRLFPAWAQTGSAGTGPDMPTLAGDDIRLTVGHSAFTVGGRTGHATTINGTLPAPLIRLREGQNVRIAVTNNFPSTRRLPRRDRAARRARHRAALRN